MTSPYLLRRLRTLAEARAERERIEADRRQQLRRASQERVYAGRLLSREEQIARGVPKDSIP